MRELRTFTEHIDALAFVPTMGALHEGHLALIKKAREYSAHVLVSIYVNPTQFESANDLANYPKTLERDSELAEKAGAEFLWTPSVSEIYPEGLENTNLIPAGPLGDLYEGVARPNHFSGVLTVINRLFSITNPQFALFGEKDFQQLFLIRQFTKEKFPNIKVISGETIRDHDGVALSSRNARLSESEMEIAKVLPRAKKRCQEITSLNELKKVLHEVLGAQPGFTLDYAEVVDPTTLLAVTGSFRGPVQILLAGWIGSVRLIDNFGGEVKEQS